VAEKQAKKTKGRRKKREAKLRIKWVKSSIGYSQRQKATIKSLGLRRLGDTVEWKDDPVTRGMINRVRHLVEVEELGN
jgi:large subunit ribosomal protein L30